MFLATRATPSVARGLAAWCLPLLVLVGACSSSEEDPEPIIPSDEPASASPSPSASASAAPAKQPWEKRTKAGAVAFVKHWVDVFNEATQSGQTESLEDLARDDCASCRVLSDEIERIYSEGGKIQGGAFDVASVGTSGPLNRNLQVAARLRAAPQVINFGDGSEKKIERSQTTFSFSIRWTDSEWRVTEVRAL